MKKPYNELLDIKNWKFEKRIDAINDLEYYVMKAQYLGASEGEYLNKYIYGYDIKGIPDDDI